MSRIPYTAKIKSRALTEFTNDEPTKEATAKDGLLDEQDAREGRPRHLVERTPDENEEEDTR